MTLITKHNLPEASKEGQGKKKQQQQKNKKTKKKQ